ncbi:MAG: hypothetical protein KJ601_03185 [Nanoarchaeota archaeon]|nr:hypothetical protein [Nanoarchaeota archaeon]MBU1703780.1 hypothetical protein [Nanoarchaeota archaeon]
MAPRDVVPLKSSFMLSSLIGFIISWLWVFPRDASWGFTFMLFFVIMFVASMISMTYQPVAFPKKRA